MALTKTELENVCRQCINNIQGLLASVSLLLDSETTAKYALGIYMYALEEYGKARILKKYLENAKGPLYTKPQAVFNYGSHNTKIAEGLKHLPIQCKKISAFFEIVVNPSSEEQVIKLENGEEVLLLPGLTGIFENSRDSSKRYIESDYKTRCFYMDFDPNDNEERNNLCGDKTIMKTNVALFRETLDKF